MTRICLDSNVLVAAFVARGLCADLLRLALSEYELVVLEMVAQEVRRVLDEKLKASPEALSAVEAFLERCDIVPRGDAPSPVVVREGGAVGHQRSCRSVLLQPAARPLTVGRQEVEGRP